MYMMLVNTVIIVSLMYMPIDIQRTCLVDELPAQKNFMQDQVNIPVHVQI